MLHARLLGQHQIFLEGQPVVISSRPTQSILAFLLLHPNTAHRREKLAGQFWPNSSESNARSNLRHELWRIRKAFGPGANARIQSDDLGVTYLPQPGDLLDVEVFESYLGDEDSTEALIETVSVYAGDLLPGFYEEWVVLERERLLADFERKLGRLLDVLLVERRWNEILEWAERWIAFGCTPEPAYRALMLAHAGMGNQAGSVTQYRRCVAALDRELGVEPSGKTRELLEQIRSGRLDSVLQKTSLSTPIRPTMPAILGGPEGLTQVFVGQKAEMAVLARRLDMALSGRAQVVFVCGEAGSGKSALLQEFGRLSAVRHPDLAVGWGNCNAFFGQGVPYLPFRDVLNMLAGGSESLYAYGTIAHSPAGRLSVCTSQVVKSLLEQGPGLTNSFLRSESWADPSTTRLPDNYSNLQRIEDFPRQRTMPVGLKGKSQLFEEYTQVLRTIADQNPLLIVLDDLQWMDPGTGGLFFHLVRRLQNSRILIAGAYRPEEIAFGRNGGRHPLEPLINEFQSTYGKITIDLDEARESSGRHFIDDFLDTEPNQLDEIFRSELHSRTHGHPLFTVQLLRNLQERGEIIPDEQGRWVAPSHLDWDIVSPKVEGIIGERIGRLDEELQELLLVASVEGEQFTVQVLGHVQETADRTILRHLSRQLEKRHRLVQEAGEVRVGERRLVRFRFVHALIQQYLYRRLGAAERVSMHRSVAETLEILYDEDIAAVAAPLARHYREAGIRDKSVEYLLLAGDQARSLYAHQEAVDLYQQALVYLKEMGETEQTARTLRKLYLVHHNAFDFQKAQQALEEGNALWQELLTRNASQPSSSAKYPYHLPTLKTAVLDPGLCETIFDMVLIKELFYGLAEWSIDQTVIPAAARHWDVLEGGRRYVFNLRDNLFWSDGAPLTARDFEFAWKRVLDPATRSSAANLLYDILGAKDYHQGRAMDSEQVGINSPNPLTLIVEMEEPCGYFPYILGDPVTFAVPRHIVVREGNAWTEPGRIVTSGAYQLESWDQPWGKTALFTRNPRYAGQFTGNIEQVTINRYENENEIYHSFVSGELDSAEFLLPQLQQAGWQLFRELGQLHISTLPFVDAVHFITDRPPFDNPAIRRAFAMATDREKLAREMENKIPATGGYIPPTLPGYTPGVGLRYNPKEARRLLGSAGYPQGSGFPQVSMLIELVGLEKGDNLVFALLEKMWKENLGVTIKKCRQDPAARQFDVNEEFNLFFLGWFADYPDPASFLQTNFLIDQTHWQNTEFEKLISDGRRTLDQDKRLDLYRQADHILMEEAVVLPLFYGHIYELRQPWVQKSAGSTIYNSQWKDIILMPH